MPVSVGRTLVIISAVAGTIFLTRLLPFLLFPEGKEIPAVIRYLGRDRSAGGVLRENGPAGGISVRPSGDDIHRGGGRASHVEA